MNVNQNLKQVSVICPQYNETYLELIVSRDCSNECGFIYIKRSYLFSIQIEIKDDAFKESINRKKISNVTNFEYVR